MITLPATQDVLISALLGLGFTMGVATATFFTYNWTDWVDAAETTPNVFEDNESDPYDFNSIRNTLGITAVSKYIHAACFVQYL